MKNLELFQTPIDSILQLVNDDTIEQKMQHLVDFGTRYAFANNRKAIALWIQQQFHNCGITNTVLDSFQLNSTIQYNVIATISSSVNTDSIYIAGAHYDSYAPTNPMSYAPGADDNASGVATLIEIARIFHLYNLHPLSTIKLIAFGGSEYALGGPLYGSIDFVNKAITNQLSINMMLNCDMGAHTLTPDNWKIKFFKYTNCGHITDFGKHIAQFYSSLLPVVQDNNNIYSDSYSFWMAGYPATFIQEYDFNNLLHTDNDTMGACNFQYAKEYTKVTAGLLLQAIQSPSPVKNFQLIDMGNGNSLKAIWQSCTNSKVSITGYKLYLGTTSGNYTASYFTTDTQLIIPSLTTGQIYYAGIACRNSLNYESMIIEKYNVPLIIPIAPVNPENISSRGNIKIQWKANTEADLAGYNIYRATFPDTNYMKINTTLIHTALYKDTLIENDLFYNYKITSVDSTNNESAYSDAVRARKMSMDQGLIIVDDSEGGLLNPTDEQVDNFYSSLLSNYQYIHYDAQTNGAPDLADFAIYSSIVWHSNNTQNSGYLDMTIKSIENFLNAGGKILFSLDRPSKAFNNNLTYPYYCALNNFLKQYLKLDSVCKNSQARFFEALSTSNSFCPIAIDTNKTPATNNHNIGNIEALFPENSDDIIYTYASTFLSGTPQATMNGWPVGIKHDNNQYKIVLLSFPLYYMQLQDAKTAIDSIFQNFFQEPLLIFSPQNDGPRKLMVFPNPAKNILYLSFPQLLENKATIEIYNTSGIKVLSLENAGIKTTGNIILLNIGHLKQGYYMGTVKNKNTINTFRFICYPD